MAQEAKASAKWWQTKNTCKKHTTTTKHFEEGQVNQITTRNKREENIMRVRECEHKKKFAAQANIISWAKS